MVEEVGESRMRLVGIDVLRGVAALGIVANLFGTSLSIFCLVFRGSCGRRLGRPSHGGAGR